MMLNHTIHRYWIIKQLCYVCVCVFILQRSPTVDSTDDDELESHAAVAFEQDNTISPNVIYLAHTPTQTYTIINTDRLLCLFYVLCYAAVLIKFTYYAQNYAQEQEMCLVCFHYLYVQIFVNKSLLIIDNLERLFY